MVNTKTITYTRLVETDKVDYPKIPLEHSFLGRLFDVFIWLLPWDIVANMEFLPEGTTLPVCVRVCDGCKIPILSNQVHPSRPTYHGLRFGGTPRQRGVQRMGYFSP